MTELDKLIDKVAYYRSQLDAIDRQANPLKERLEQAKLDLIKHMQATGSKRTEAYKGYFAVRAERTTTSITDAQSLLDYIEEQGFDTSEYLKIDDARAKALAESTLKETGEIVPGVVFDSTEYLSIKKEAK